MYIDIFNGDADGILSLVQLRKAFPVDKSDQRLITGVKRDIELCRQALNTQNAQITVLDISFDKNVNEVKSLVQENKVEYFDHHKADKLFQHDNLSTHIDLSADICTALLVSKSINEKHHLWAIAAAYGDNLCQRAELESDKLNLTNLQREQLKEFGILVNYNGYGASIEDLHFHPADLYQELVKYDSPFDVIADESSCFHKLKKGFKDDDAKLSDLQAETKGAVYILKLPNQSWARRISGTIGNELANKYRDKAIVIATEKANSNYLISLRAPKDKQLGASEICSKFPSGGGRAAAAGVNDLRFNELAGFVDSVNTFYTKDF